MKSDLRYLVEFVLLVAVAIGLYVMLQFIGAPV